MMRGAKGEISRPSHSLSSFVNADVFLRATLQPPASTINDVVEVPGGNKQ